MIYRTEAYLSSAEGNASRVLRKRFAALTHVTHVTTRHGLVELDGATRSEALEHAEHWICQLGHPSARVYEVRANGELGHGSGVLDFRDFSDEAA